MRQLHVGRQKVVGRWPYGHRFRMSRLREASRNHSSTHCLLMDEKCYFYFDVDYSSDFNDYNYDSKDIIIGTCGTRGPKRLSFLQLNCRNCQAVMHEV